MKALTKRAGRFEHASAQKATGATYTPTALSNFVSDQMLADWHVPPSGSLRLLDPAVGDGELLCSLIAGLPASARKRARVVGFDCDSNALEVARRRLSLLVESHQLELVHGDFLESAGATAPSGGLFTSHTLGAFDLVIANPPYVRTQVMGSHIARGLAEAFGLTGRVDLYQAFILAIAKCLKPSGTMGLIVSNRFMSTKAGATVRRALIEQTRLKRVWDLGDTKLFDAAVLPAVIVANGRVEASGDAASFTSIYSDEGPAEHYVTSVFDALGFQGVVEITDGRRFAVSSGRLDHAPGPDGVWRVSTDQGDTWLATVARHSWKTFGDIGKVRVGVKTCADKIFIRSDWDSLGVSQRPELLRALTTHHVGRPFRAAPDDVRREILYPHEIAGGRRTPVNLQRFPKSRAYLESHRAELEARSYVLEAGRQWYEIWVPHDPETWSRPKLVFRDISEEPCFWMDLDQTVVNGDCYWISSARPEDEDLLWLATGVANSSFITAFYDRRFNNRLYAGRRRFITQYVEQFPLPDPGLDSAREIIASAREIYSAGSEELRQSLRHELNRQVWRVFGFSDKEATRQRNL
jgi:adenine-specific DNA-methyltransferase